MRKEQPVVSVAGRQDRRRGDGRLGPASVCSCAGIASWPAALRSGHPQRPVGGDGSALHRQVSFVLLAFILVDSTLGCDKKCNQVSAGERERERDAIGLCNITKEYSLSFLADGGGLFIRNQSLAFVW